jgi:hypothetical protein
MRRIGLLLLMMFTIPLVLDAADGNVWKKWGKELRRQCPANHVQWISDPEQDELIADFEKTLPTATQMKIDAIADYTHRCSQVKIGFYCEMAVHLDALIRLGLLKQFAAFGCQHYKCTEPALCTKDGR